MIWPCCFFFAHTTRFAYRLGANLYAQEPLGSRGLRGKKRNTNAVGILLSFFWAINSVPDNMLEKSGKSRYQRHDEFFTRIRSYYVTSINSESVSYWLRYLTQTASSGHEVGITLPLLFVAMASGHNDPDTSQWKCDSQDHLQFFPCGLQYQRTNYEHHLVSIRWP